MRILQYSLVGNFFSWYVQTNVGPTSIFGYDGLGTSFQGCLRTFINFLELIISIVLVRNPNDRSLLSLSLYHMLSIKSLPDTSVNETMVKFPNYVTLLGLLLMKSFPAIQNRLNILKEGLQFSRGAFYLHLGGALNQYFCSFVKQSLLRVFESLKSVQTLAHYVV